LLGGAVTKKSVLALTLIFALFSIMTEVKLVDWAVANPYPYTNCDSSFVTVSVISPENKTYDSNSILLNITAGAYPGIFFVGYCLDGGPFVQVAPEKWDAHTFSESVWLNELSKGSHYIIVEASAPETPNNVVTDASQVYFTITRDLVPEPTPSPLKISLLGVLQVLWLLFFWSCYTISPEENNPNLDHQRVYKKTIKTKFWKD